MQALNIGAQARRTRTKVKNFLNIKVEEMVWLRLIFFVFLSD
jgi:hypothetical protein